jgi:hypothetical protein
VALLCQTKDEKFVFKKGTLNEKQITLLDGFVESYDKLGHQKATENLKAGFQNAKTKELQ